MNPYIKQLHWRYATKVFDADKKIDDATIKSLQEAIQLSASSYGLQPYKVLNVEDKEIRRQLRTASWDQAQITDASHLFVFVNNTRMDGKEVDNYISVVGTVRQIEAEKLSRYADFIKSKTVNLPTEIKKSWTARQAYIALGNLLSAAAMFEVDTCPIEGFEMKNVNQILGLDSAKYSACVIVAIGYRSNDDTTQHLPKVRTPFDELFETI